MKRASVIPRLDPTARTPLYHQMVLHFQGLIRDGVLQPGDQMPSERRLSVEAGVSRMTVRQAMRSLVAEHYCERVSGRGIYVRSRPVIIDAHSFEGFTENMVRQGLTATTRSVRSHVVTPPTWVAESIDLGPDGLAVELVRLRLINDEPAILETEWLPALRFPGLEQHDMSQSLYALLEHEYATRVASTLDVLEAHLPTPEERRMLGTPARTPVIARNRVGRTDDGTPVEVVRSVYHPAQYQFRMALVPAAPTE